VSSPTTNIEPAPAGMRVPLLRVDGLTIAFRNDGREVRPVEDLSFEIGAHERLGMVGESGSGKSLTILSVLGLISAPGLHVSGTLEFDGQRFDLGSEELRRLRGREISMIFQEPMTALDPVFTVGHQLREAIRRHRHVSRSQGKVLAIEALANVGIPDPRQRYDQYPHQLSGGMRQRVMIAIAVACEPKLLLADEPTTALDVTTQAQILDLLRELNSTTGMAILLVSHDLGVIADLCDRVVCVYAGEVVEDASLEMALRAPSHPYLEGLLKAMPRVGSRGTQLYAIPGSVPAPGTAPHGCHFGSRCSYFQGECTQRQVLLPSRRGGSVRCIRHDELDLAGVGGSAPGGVVP
jgi:peptide/nickel transport system ATP-binding protein